MSTIFKRDPEPKDVKTPRFFCESIDCGGELFTPDKLWWFDGQEDESGDAPGQFPGFYCGACWEYPNLDPGISLEEYLRSRP